MLLLSVPTAAFADKDLPTAVDKDGYTVTVEEYVDQFGEALKFIWTDITDTTIKKLAVEKTESSNVYHVKISDLTNTDISLQLYRNDEVPGEKETIDSAVILIMGTEKDEDMYLFLVAASAMILLVDDEVKDSVDAREVLDDILDAAKKGESFTKGNFEYTLETSKSLGFPIYYLSVNQK